MFKERQKKETFENCRLSQPCISMIHQNIYPISFLWLCFIKHSNGIHTCTHTHTHTHTHSHIWSSQVVLVIKNLPANSGDAADTDSIFWSGRSSGDRNGYLLQSSCQENPMDRGAWRATVHGVAKSWT